MSTSEVATSVDEVIDQTRARRSRKAPEPVTEAPVIEHGSKGQAQYEAVKALVSSGMKTQDAFAQVAEELGTKPGTIATAYYRIARKDSDSPVQARPRKRRVVARASSPAKSRSLSDRLEAILAEVKEMEADAELGKAVRSVAKHG